MWDYRDHMIWTEKNLDNNKQVSLKYDQITGCKQGS